MRRGGGLALPLNQMTWPEVARLALVGHILKQCGVRKDDLQHAIMLCDILTDSENPELKDMKLSVSIYAKGVYRVITAVGHN